MGAVASFVGDVFDAVGDVVEGVGDVVEDAVDVVKEAGSWIDDNIIQPAKDDPLKTAVMVAATVYAGPAAASYFGTTAATGAAIAAGTASATTTLASGGDIGDALKAGVTSAAAAGVGYQAGGATLSETGSKVAAGAARGATAGVTRAALTGGDLETGLLTGGVTGAVAAGVNESYNAARAELDALTTPAVEPTGETFGDQPGDFPTEGGSYGSPTAEGVNAATNRLLNYNAAYATPKDTEAEKILKREATKAISGKVLGLDDKPTMPSFTPPQPVSIPKEGDFDYTDQWKEDKKPFVPPRTLATDQVQKEAIVPKQYQDATGNIITILYKDDKPLSPVPEGAVALAEGGLVDSGSTTMVKYSKKPLLAPRKEVKKPKKNKIAGKGLAVKKT
jgi:hypothetical protein